jgi:hypothetical protein
MMHDYYTIEENNGGGYDVFGHRIDEDAPDAIAGDTNKSFVEHYPFLDDAQKEYPKASLVGIASPDLDEFA